MGNETTVSSGTFGETERTPRHTNGLAILALNILLMIGSVVLFIVSVIAMDSGGETPLRIAGAIGSLVWLCVVGPILFGGVKVLKPNEAMVLTLFGKYFGVLREPGIFFVNPFASAVRPASTVELSTASTTDKGAGAARGAGTTVKAASKTLSLKAMTLSNDKQKINDALGNPIIIGIVVVWKVVNPTKAVFNVDNYAEYLSIQCDSALRNIVRLYPYDASDSEGETSLRGSSQEIADRLKDEIQAKAAAAGIEILEARITHLSYAPEIAAAMLQRQQASAVIAARQMIVDGAVGMVELALDKLKANNIVDLDEERKAAMVSNLLVVLCSNKDVSPIVNSGSIY